MEPKRGERWKVKLWNRTYWGHATVTLERHVWTDWDVPSGWLFKRNPDSAMPETRSTRHIQFIERVS